MVFTGILNSMSLGSRSVFSFLPKRGLGRHFKQGTGKRKSTQKQAHYLPLTIVFEFKYGVVKTVKG